MIMITDSAKDIKTFLKCTQLSEFVRPMVMRLMLTFTVHRGRMSCSLTGGEGWSEYF